MQKALISPISGTTRNVNIGTVTWRGTTFELVDTGGIESIIPKKKRKHKESEANIDFLYEIIDQTHAYLKTADLILFVVDAQEGILPQDRELAQYIKKHHPDTQILLVANKAEKKKMRDTVISELYTLAMNEPHPVSAKSGTGTGDLLDAIYEQLEQKGVLPEAETEKEDEITVSIVGRPNVGKSSLFNALIGEEKVIVSEVSGTTRETFDTVVEYDSRRVRYIDTAGLRRKSRVKVGSLEKASNKRAISASKNADISLLVIDVSEPVAVQDLQIARLLTEHRTSVIIVANKWDMVDEKETNTQEKYKEYLRYQFPFLTWAPIVFVSAKTHKGVHHIYEAIEKVYEGRHKEISDAVLSRFLKQSLKKHRPTSMKGTKPPFLTNIKQVRTNPPTFELSIGTKDTLNPTYLRYLENQLRDKFDIPGTPIQVNIRK